MPRRRSARISMLLIYSPSMVGAWLEPNVLTLPSRCTAGEAKRRLAQDGYLDFHRIYVVDEQSHVQGYVRLAALINASDNDHNRQIDRAFHKCAAREYGA